ncbi:T9SS type A sorting domain-containing protein [Winogradskyella forsetii]|uniref:T9SS type A sorting domain-containing protein n=1 Tax=Winogradskyella forsetii TaxID=2686077 RepID=UPI0015BE4706|nr:T9SS type A sorting domain-containing protein [Winogradskyella forsetii]
MKKIYLFTLLITCFLSDAQTINIPDNTFRNALINDNVVDTNNDFIPDSDADLNDNGLIELSEALSVTYLNLYYFDLSSSQKIQNLEGIQHFQNLEWLDIEFNDISNIDILNQNQNLYWLDADSNSISSINFAANTNLQYIFLYDNNLTELDVSQISNLIRLSCQSNGNLNYLNIQNGNNSNIIELVATQNPNLTCIQVDNVSYANSQTCNQTADTGFCVDPIASYNTNCNLSIEDYEKIKIKAYPNPTESKLTIQSLKSIERITVYSILGNVVSEELNSSSIDLSNLNSGVYLVNVSTENRTEILKVIKE